MSKNRNSTLRRTARLGFIFAPDRSLEIPLPAAAALLMATMCIGCSKSKPASGQHCAADEKAVCADSGNTLTCKAGVWATVPCRGPAGCAAGDDGTKCDDSVGKSGEACLPGRKGHAVCSETEELLTCNGDSWVASSCKGVGKCAVSEGDARCSGTVALGTACMDSLANSLCAIDRSAVLACKQGKYQIELSCGGNQCVMTELGAGCPQ